MTRVPVWPLLVVGLLSALAPAKALAQEGASDLTPPRAPPAGDAATPLAPAPEPGAEGTSPEATVEAPTSYEVPPPPAAPRYPSAGTESSRTESVDESSQIELPSRIRTRIRVLDADLTALSNRGGNGIVDGVLSILSGGLSIALGVLVDEDLLATYLYLWGGANVARGVIDIAISPNASEAAIAFSHMPMGSVEEAEERLRFGEDALSDLARRTRIARILDASLNMAVGVAVVPLYLAPNDFKIQSPFD